MPERPRLLVSACLLGVPCRYDGGSQPLKGLDALAERYEVIPVCPEQLGGLSTPRPPSERRGSRVVTLDGADVTDAFRRGAEETVRLARRRGAKLALLKARSPSCGFGAIYDGRFTGRLVEGSGVAAEALARADIDIYSEAQLDRLAARQEDENDTV